MSTKKSKIAEIVGKSVSAFIKNGDQSDKSKIGSGSARIVAEMVTQFRALSQNPPLGEEEEKKGNSTNTGNTRSK